MGQEAKIKEVVRRWRKGEITVDMDNLEKFVSGLRERTLSRTLARSAGMQTKYTEEFEGKGRAYPWQPRTTRRAYYE